MRYLFKHILMRDVVYDMQLRSHLRDLHHQAAIAIEALYASELSPHYADLAYHYEQAGMDAQAIVYLHKAGDHASETYDVQGAIAYYQRALDLVSQGKGGASRRIALYEGLGKMLRLQGRYPEATMVSQAMLATARALGDEAAQARAWYELSWTQNTQGHNQEALTSAGQAEAVARQAGAQIELTNALILKGWALFRLGDPDAALSLGEQALDISISLEAELKQASALNLLSTAYDALGRYERAMRLTREALARYRTLGRQQEEGVMLNNLGTTVGAFGDYSAAIAIFKEALTIAREIGDRHSEMLCLSNLGGMQIGMQDYHAAEVSLHQAIHIAESVGIKFPEAHSFLAEAYLGRGRLQDALTVARRALALAQATQEDVAGAWRALGKVVAQLPDPIVIGEERYDAAACFAEALRVFTAMGAAGERARTLRTWAKHELAHGDREHGLTMWQEAREIFERLGMSLEVERMAAAL